jgi:integration host factor subunit beta
MRLMSTTTKRDLIDRVSDNSIYSKAEVRDLIERVFEVIADDLAAGKRIEFRQFGVFEVRERRPRLAKNPKTNQKVDVPARMAVRFKPGQELKTKVNAAHAKRNGEVVVVNTAGQTAGV